MISARARLWILVSRFPLDYWDDEEKFYRVYFWNLKVNFLKIWVDLRCLYTCENNHWLINRAACVDVKVGTSTFAKQPYMRHWKLTSPRLSVCHERSIETGKNCIHQWFSHSIVHLVIEKTAIKSREYDDNLEKISISYSEDLDRVLGKSSSDIRRSPSWNR